MAGDERQVREQSSVRLVGRLLREALIYRRLLILSALAIVGSSITTMLAPYILGRTIDEYIVPGTLGHGFLLMFLAYLATLLGQWLFSTLQTRYTQFFGQHVLYRLRQRLAEKLVEADIHFFEGRKTGDLVSRVINDTAMVNDVLVSGLLGGIGSLLSLTGIVAAMLYLDVKLTLVTLSTVPVMVFIARFFGGRVRHAYRETREKVAKISSVVEESVAGVETVKAFGRERMAETEFSRASLETVKAYLRVAVYMGFFWPLMNISTLFSVIIVAVYGAHLVAQGAASVGVVVAFIQYAQRFRGPINNVVMMYDSLQSALASLDRIYEVIDSPMVEDDEGLEVGKLSGRIEFRHVWFEYVPGRPVLKDVNLEIPPGTIVALVGPTGSGKTTLASLLLRFNDPTRGAVLVDGLDTREIRRSSLRSRIGYVPQETYLFPGTILENILVAKPDATREEVERVARALGVHDAIARLPKGYDTPAGEAGRLLSVGEKQLISLARAMLRDPDIVILDEALSSVDPQTENRVQQAMLKLMKGRTSIVIAHRLTITRYANQVVVLENGRIVETGTPDELLARKGHFHQLYQLQTQTASAILRG